MRPADYLAFYAERFHTVEVDESPIPRLIRHVEIEPVYSERLLESFDCP